MHMHVIIHILIDCFNRVWAFDRTDKYITEIWRGNIYIWKYDAISISRCVVFAKSLYSLARELVDTSVLETAIVDLVFGGKSGFKNRISA